MLIVKTIRNLGVAGFIKAIGGKCVEFTNFVLYYICQAFPVNEHLMVLESEGDLSDNAYAFYSYLRENDYLEQYRVVWLVDDIDGVKEKKSIFPNTCFVYKQATRHISFMRAKSLATCKWYIYDHCNVMSYLKKRSEQKNVYLSHGWGYKAAKGKSNLNYDIVTVTGKLSAVGISGFWNEPLSKAVITGYPRIDYFYKDTTITKLIVNKKWNFKQYKKVIFWMPTFRQCTNKDLSENYIQNETGLPLFNTRDDLNSFSLFLLEKNILLVLKQHHLQAEIEVHTEKFKNILMLSDKDINNLGLQLYEFIPLADALITDYSSIAIDYLCLDKPIIYTLDDYVEYNESRGLFPKDAINYMPGYHVYNISELKQCLIDILNDMDVFKYDRANIIDEYHQYKDGNSSKRILELLNIEKENI